MARQLRLKIDVATNQLRSKFKSVETGAKDEFKMALHDAAKAVRNRAKTHHRFQNRTGNLERAIRYRVKTDRGGWGGVGEIYLDDRIAPYGRFVHEGTKRHLIKPNSYYGKLRFRWDNVGGQVVTFRHVWHPGIGNSPFGYTRSNKMPDDFIYRANRAMRAEVNRIFRERLDEALARGNSKKRGGNNG